MDFIKQTYSLKKLVRSLHQASDIPDKHTTEKQEQATVSDLSQYVYDRLFLPLIHHGTVPLKGLDFGLISEDDLDLLNQVLDRCDIFPLVRMGLQFNQMPPTSAVKAKFI